MGPQVKPKTLGRQHEMERFPTLLTDEESRAVERFVAACTVPLIQEDNATTAVLGTGNLFEVCGRLFLVSASHVFEDFQPERVGIPAEVLGNRRILRTFDGCRRHYWNSDGLDVTVVEFPSGEFSQSLRAVHQVLTPENVLIHPTHFEQYFLLGYPSSKAVTDGKAITPRAIAIVSTPYLGEPPKNFQSDREFLLQYAETGWTERGELSPTADLPGVSGSAVWGILPPQQLIGLWSPASAVKVVGVQHAYLKSAYIRCHFWWLVARMFQKIDPTLGDALGVPPSTL